MNFSERRSAPVNPTVLDPKPFGLEALEEHSDACGALFASRLHAPYLAAPISVFLREVAQLSYLDGVALAICRNDIMGVTLATYAITDSTSLSAEEEGILATQFDDAFDHLDAAVYEGPVPIGMSSEFINRGSASLDTVAVKLKRGEIPSLCGIDISPADSVAILVFE
jgi:hypothetical protein